MDTKNFNIVDRLIAEMRLSKVLPYVEKGDVVLDFGCGNQGFFLNYVSPVIKKGVGIDYDVDNKTNSNLLFKKFIFENRLPFKDESFDKVIMLAVLEHVETNKVDLLFKELKRVLKNNGKIVLTTPTPPSKPILEFLAYKLHIISENEIRDHKKYYCKKDVQKLIERCNLKIISYKLFQFRLNSCIIIQ